jgi:hypothetical protein
MCARKKNVGDIHWLPVTDKGGFLHSKWPARCTSCTRFIHRPDTTGACGNIWLQSSDCCWYCMIQICKQQWDKGCWNVIVVVATRGPEVQPLSTLFISSDVLGDVSCFFKFIWRSIIAEFFIRVDKTLASHSRGSGFKYRPGDRLSWGFYCFSQSIQANFGLVYQIRPRPLSLASLLIHYSQLLLPFNR